MCGWGRSWRPALDASKSIEYHFQTFDKAKAMIDVSRIPFELPCLESAFQALRYRTAWPH